MVVTCAVRDCYSSSRHHKDRRFFHFPKDERRCRQWVKLAGRAELIDKGIKKLWKSYLICDLHFEPSQRLSKKLVLGAIPSLELPDQNAAGNKHKSTQTEFVMLIPEIVYEDENWTPENEPNSPLQFKRSLSTTEDGEVPSKKIKLEECDEQTDELTEQAIPNQLQKMIDLQSQVKHMNIHNRKRAFMLFALNSFVASPAAYRVLGETLGMPSEDALRKMQMNIGTVIDPHILHCLQTKMKNCDVKEKYCVVSASFINLQSEFAYEVDRDTIVGCHDINNARRMERAAVALVITVNGLLSSWLQPVAYCFLPSKTLSKTTIAWIDYAIYKIQNIGLNVVALVAPTSFEEYAKVKRVTSDKSYFHIDGNKINYTYDILDSVKTLLNELMLYDIEYEVNGTKFTASWKDIEMLYEVDCRRENGLTHADRLRDVRVIFNQTFVTAMKCLIEQNELPDRSMGTMRLIKLIIELLNTINRPEDDETSQLAEARISCIYNTLSTFRSSDNSKSCTSTEYLKISINSISLLSKEIDSVKSRLNTNAVDLFLSSLSSETSEMTAAKFNRIYDEHCKLKMMNPIENTVSSYDLEQFLAALCDATKFNGVRDDIIPQSQDITEAALALVGELSKYSKPKERYDYTCYYLLKKCYEIHDCVLLDRYVNLADGNTSDKPSLLIQTPKTFCDLIKMLAEQFKDIFVKKVDGCLREEILIETKDFKFNSACPCFPMEYLKELFVTFRIYYLLHISNKKHSKEQTKDGV